MKPSKERSGRQIGVRISDELYEELERIAERRPGGLKVSHIVREALIEKIEKEKKGDK